MSLPRRIGVVGAGAIGGYLAARFALAGHEVAIVARGAHLDAVRRDGLRLRTREGERTARVLATDRAAGLGPCDVVFLTVKAHGIEALADAVAGLARPGVPLVPVLNGIPWWYFQGLDGPFRDRPVRAVDPEGRLLARFGASTLVGGVAHTAATLEGPGIVRLTTDGDFLFGAADPRDDAAARLVAQAAEAAGLRARASEAIRRDIWVKLAGNAAFNPVSALTGARFGEICASEPLLAIVRAAMREAMAVGGRHGIDFPVDVEARIAMAGKVGGAKSSMLQDLERGRPVETGAILGAVVELGRLAGVPAPTLALLEALVAERANHPPGGD
ncbi:2-dehydropantoate 2-reductase [Arenibaculum sp.]|jgi:2-dehydropantoate 2-reductase|uniref:ketopantoate reductase family protein n=1 Tax=Arenibaculum sp. TaxID=2865862 RepID=UPI002E106E64|nr:2-dehydropantoate 2-reductase [Arenibaculum sp.]